MHIHILGICGTFMGGVAILAKSLGYKVTGSDKNVYPPMSTQLEEQGIENCYQQSLFHRISGDQALDSLSVSSKLNSEWPFLCHLFDQGREAADNWITANFDAIGHRSTLDIDAVYLPE